ncbi:hypothetical protein BGZ76_007998 [Entomortierella beljakovae]|nr:hypothetical protein BGZ76_007998 [Entomortierella beljakovae]
MIVYVVYLRVQPSVEDKKAMDDAFSFALPHVMYVTDVVKPDVIPYIYVEYNGLVGETSGQHYVTLHYVEENVVIKASFSGLRMAMLGYEMGKFLVEELVDKAKRAPDNIMYLYGSELDIVTPVLKDQ